MAKFLLLLTVVIVICACDKRLNEKTFMNSDIKVSWYEVSAITSGHEFVEVSKGLSREKIMEANQGTIDSIYIKGAAIFIKKKSANVVYTLKDSAFGYKIKCSF